MQEGLKNSGGHWNCEKLTLADKVLMDLIPDDGVLTSRQDISKVMGVSWDTANNSLRRLTDLGLVSVEAERRKAVVIRKTLSDKCQEAENSNCDDWHCGNSCGGINLGNAKINGVCE